jgi:endo-1,4-beta-xylanase
LGLDVHITEADVRIKEPTTDAKLEKQARIYSDLLRLCLEADSCGAFVMWGFTDKYSWIETSGLFTGYHDAVLFDENYKARPAYYYLKEALAEFSSN